MLVGYSSFVQFHFLSLCLIGNLAVYTESSTGSYGEDAIASAVAMKQCVPCFFALQSRI